MSQENRGFVPPPPAEEPSEEKKKPTRREILAGIGLVTLGAAVGSMFTRERTGETQEETEAAKDFLEEIPESERIFFEDYENGEFPAEERRKRFQTLAPGVKVFRDIGLDFYIVQRGDSIKSIRSKVSAIPGFEYVADQKMKIQSFNIPERSLRPGMFIPIPLKNEDRHIPDEEFAEHAARALEHISAHPRYGKYIEHLKTKYSEKEIYAVMVALARQESGGRHIGQFALHRWEPHHSAFSFSIFHVLMVGPGLRARRRLKRTEGQLYHPQNAAELFFAFMIEKLDDMHPNSPKGEEKIKADLVDLFQLDEKMARFYNGRAWKRGNPHYLKNIQKYRGEAAKMLKNKRLR